MTVPAPSGPAKRSRRMLGFYVAMGVALALAVSFYFAWTPLRVRYWEREVRREAPGYSRRPQVSQDGRVVFVNMVLGDPAGKLAALGPGSAPAFERLLRAEAPGVRLAAVEGLHRARAEWCVPLLVGAVGDADSEVSVTATRAVADIMKNGLHKSSQLDLTRAVNLYLSLRQKEPARLRQEVLDWWESEGQAKYGGAEE